MGSGANNNEDKRLGDTEKRLSNFYYFAARPQIYIFFHHAWRRNIGNVCDR